MDPPPAHGGSDTTKMGSVVLTCGGEGGAALGPKDMT